MDFFSVEFFSALAAIIVIDLVLAGDNAIVIALAARNLPRHLQKKAILWGTMGAIVVRALMTMIVVSLLKIPGLMVVGGLARAKEFDRDTAVYVKGMTARQIRETLKLR